MPAGVPKHKKQVDRTELDRIERDIDKLFAEKEQYLYDWNKRLGELRTERDGLEKDYHVRVRAHAREELIRGRG